MARAILTLKRHSDAEVGDPILSKPRNRTTTRSTVFPVASQKWLAIASSQWHRSRSGTPATGWRRCSRTR